MKAYFQIFQKKKKEEFITKEGHSMFALHLKLSTLELQAVLPQ